MDETPYWYPEDIDIILEEIQNAEMVFSKHSKQEGSVYYKNVAASFDTETTSLYYEGEKTAVMYVWMFSVNGKVILGRTWEGFEDLISRVEDLLDTEHRLIVYVHNLAFDFSFFNRRLHWHKTFCTKVHEPIYAITCGGIEFRDSLILTGKSLAKSAEDLNTYKVSKLTGNVDYTLKRGSTTKLTDDEIAYCIHDCLVLDAIIQEKIEQEGSIAKIPLTNTGYVRRFLHEKCFPKYKGKYTNDAMNYKRLISDLTIRPEEYGMLKRAFMGGFTHANAFYVGQHIKGEIDSFDFTSSYPAVILSELMPMSKAMHYNNVTKDQFDQLLKDYLLIFDVKFNKLTPKAGTYENYLSVSKGRGENVIENNGRVVSADYFITTITSVDFEVIRAFYDYESIQVGEILAYYKGYMPKPIIEGALELYKAKTELKGVEDKQVEYQIKKGMFNSIYGCCVTDILKDVIEYTDNGWSKTSPNVVEAIEQYNSSKKRFLYYPWGIFITAYARRNLFYGIKEFGLDYIYSDTDSIKCLNADNHVKFIEWYNKLITIKVSNCLNYYGIDPKEASPKTIKGEEKPIGVWDWETKNCKYTEFKTLGAKRYMYTQVEKDHGHLQSKIHITIAGLGKVQGGKYIGRRKDPYKYFNDKMVVPEESTGKMLHSYIDSPTVGRFIDYQHNVVHFSEYCGTHLEPTRYSLKLTDAFKDFLNGYYECDTIAT